MKQTISINLNQQVFYVDVDAYDKLNKYLDEIKKYFSKESAEIIDDIEARIAEKFSDLIGKSKKSITLSDVKKIIEEIGTINDIAGEEKEEVVDETKNIKRKLFRDPETKILAGVCSGLAYYLNVKSIWIRIAVLILFCIPATTWLVIVGYLAGWLVIPEAGTSLEKLEMKGLPATVSELQTSIEKKASNTISSLEIKTGNIFQKLISICIGLLKFFTKLFFRIVGFFGLMSLICLVVCVVFGLVFVYFEPTLPYFDFSFLKEINSPFLEILFVAAGVIAITPIAFFMNIAESFMRCKWLVSFKKIIIMLSVWIAAIMVFAGISKVYYPKFSDKMTNAINHIKYLNWIDDSYSETLSIKDISDIDISSVKEVYITQSNTNEVKIIGNKFEVNNLKQNYSNNKLTIVGRSEKWFGCQNCGGYVSSVRVEIKSKNIKNINLDNNIDAWFYPTYGDFNINAGNKIGLKIIGKLNSAKISAGPYSVINALELNANNIDLNLKKSSAKIWAQKITLAGDNQSLLIFKGTPKISSSSQDNVVREKYFLSEDQEKLETAVKEATVTIDGVTKKIDNFVWYKQVISQKDDESYNIFTTVKLKEGDNKVYLVWLTEKDNLITQKTFFKINNLENVDYINLINNKNIEISGQIYGPEMENQIINIFIDRANNKLQIIPQNETN